MLVVDLTYKKDLSIVDRYLQEHRAFLQTYYDQGIFIASGPKNPRIGGIILALTDETTMQAIIAKDPFFREQIADYHITCFDPVKYCHALKALIEDN